MKFYACKLLEGRKKVVSEVGLQEWLPEEFLIYLGELPLLTLQVQEHTP